MADAVCRGDPVLVVMLAILVVLLMVMLIAALLVTLTMVMMVLTVLVLMVTVILVMLAWGSGAWYRGPELTFLSPNLLKPQPPSKSRDKEMGYRSPLNSLGAIFESENGSHNRSPKLPSSASL